ncbi:hypothetical protein [Nocardioides sp.]|jgi:hypothetical protein|uniref:hypothetical protein n=1 Tax=Nocardioides sp. TaxID=35761 RepID=UPI0026108730|nr:hypothetical protein [Nocardioides sp.]
MLPEIILHLSDPIPEPADVKAGWTAFIIFLLLFVGVVLLGFSMARQFKKTERNRDAGILPTQKPRVDSSGNPQNH